MFIMIVEIFFIILFIVENLCKIFLILMYLMVVFGNEDSRIWCKEFFSVVL